MSNHIPPTLQEADDACDKIELNGVYLAAMHKALFDKIEAIQGLAELPRQEVNPGLIAEAAMQAIDLLAITSDFGQKIRDAEQIAGHYLKHAARAGFGRSVAA